MLLTTIESQISTKSSYSLQKGLVPIVYARLLYNQCQCSIATSKTVD